MAKNTFSLRSRFRSFKYAFQGLGHLFRFEHNCWIHATIMMIALVIGFIVKLDALEWIMLVFAIGLVFIAEIFNTAIERLTDLKSPDVHPLAKQAKDLGAAAVLVASVIAIIIGLIIFIPKVFA